LQKALHDFHIEDSPRGVDVVHYTVKDFEECEIFVGKNENDISPNHVICYGGRIHTNFEPIQIDGHTPILVKCSMPKCAHDISLVLISHTERETFNSTEKKQICADREGVLLLDSKSGGKIFMAYIPVIMNENISVALGNDDEGLENDLLGSDNSESDG